MQKSGNKGVPFMLRTAAEPGDGSAVDDGNETPARLVLPHLPNTQQGSQAHCNAVHDAPVPNPGRMQSVRQQQSVRCTKDGNEVLFHSGVHKPQAPRQNNPKHVKVVHEESQLILALCIQGGGVVAAIQEATEMDMNSIEQAVNQRVSCRLDRFNSTLHPQNCVLQASILHENSEDEEEDEHASLPWWQKVAQNIVSAPVRA